MKEGCTIFGGREMVLAISYGCYMLAEQAVDYAEQGLDSEAGSCPTHGTHAWGESAAADACGNGWRQLSR